MCALGALVATPVLAGDCTPDWDYPIGQPGLSGYIAKYAAWDDGTGEKLYATGQFTSAGGNTANRLAVWDGTSWSQVSPLGPSDSWGNTLLPYQGKLIMGGVWGSIGGMPDTRSLAAWNGASWESMGTGWDFFADACWALAEFQGDLYVGGSFTDAGGVTASNIARWDGENWSDVSGGVTLGVATIVLDMLTWDDGNGEALYVAGRFDLAGGVESKLVAKWDGANWTSLDGGLGGTQVLGLRVWDDGNGEALYACGGQNTFPGQPGSNIFKWDGTTWTALPDIAESSKLIYNLEPYDDGSGEALYAIGSFEELFPRFARWDGSTWSGVAGGIGGGNGFELHTWDNPADEDGTNLFLGGSFTTAGGVSSVRAALYNGCTVAPPTCPGDLDGDNMVTSNDLNILLAAFGANGDGDLDDDGDTDSADLNILLAAFGDNC